MKIYKISAEINQEKNPTAATYQWINKRNYQNYNYVPYKRNFVKIFEIEII